MYSSVILRLSFNLGACLYFQMNFSLESAALKSLKAWFYDNNWVYYVGYSSDRKCYDLKKINLNDGQTVELGTIADEIKFLA